VAHHPITTNISNNLTPTNQTTTHTPTHLHTYTPIYLTSYCLLPALSSSVPVSLCPLPSARPPNPHAPRLSRPPMPRHPAPSSPLPLHPPYESPFLPPLLPLFASLLRGFACCARELGASWIRGRILDPIHAQLIHARRESRLPVASSCPSSHRVIPGDRERLRQCGTPLRRFPSWFSLQPETYSLHRCQCRRVSAA
jgi:hypothetical protein